MTDRDLLARIARAAGGKAGYKQLVRELGLGGGRERRLLLEQLARMTARGDLVKDDREFWSIPKTPIMGGARRGNTRENLMAGRLDLHRDGYGFVRPNARQGSGQDEDVFIPPDEINGAMQGDQVLVELAPPRADGRKLGRIARVLERRNPTVVGVFHYARSGRKMAGDPGDGSSSLRWLGHRVVPFDERMTQHILIPEGQELTAAQEVSPHRVIGAETMPHPHEDLEGLVVDVEITSWPTPTRPPMGRVIEVLGDPDDFGVDVEMVIRKHQLPRVFPEKVLEEAREAKRLHEGKIQIQPQILQSAHPADHISSAEPQTRSVQDDRPLGHRQDFRGLPIVTIDGETARDFDDAVMVTERGDGGFELQVHIADVAEYVGAGTDLDLEARLRGTSVYFPDRAIPMLPQELSTDICSLRPGEDRLVLSCVLQLSAEGRIESYAIEEGVIRSAARMTYTDVHAILEGDAEKREKYAGLVADFERMKQLALLMNQRREERGSIDFDLPEPVIEFDDQGQMNGVTKAERTWANRLIEEFMLAANECVAAWLEDMGVPSLYRIHEKPEARRVVQFEELASSFGYSLGLGALPVKKIQTRGDRREAQRTGRAARTHEVAEDIAVTPKMYQKLAARIEGKPEERILSYLMLRSLRQARYSEINEGHFALAAPTYTHFTSPIRRYPDLIVHRITKRLLRAGVQGRGEVAAGRLSSPWWHPHEGGGVDSHVSQVSKTRAGAPKWRGHPAQDDKLKIDAPIAEAELAQIAEESSQAERQAAEAERELVEWKKVKFMQDRVGEEFAALVLNPTKYGLFVELTDLFVEGLVPLDTLRDDRYTWRENTHDIVGERWGRRFRAGDRVQVILDRILAQERRLQFSIVEEGIERTGKPKPAGKKLKKERRREAKTVVARTKKRFVKKRRHR